MENVTSRDVFEREENSDPDNGKYDFPDSLKCWENPILGIGFIHGEITFI